MRTSKAANRHIPSLRLARGQLWRTEGSYIKIVELGKTLIHYKMLRDLKHMRRTQTTVLETMENYLKSHRAQLVTGVSTN